MCRYLKSAVAGASLKFPGRKDKILNKFKQLAQN